MKPGEGAEATEKMEPPNALLIIECLAYRIVISSFELGVGDVDWFIRMHEVPFKAGSDGDSKGMVFGVFQCCHEFAYGSRASAVRLAADEMDLVFWFG